MILVVEVISGGSGGRGWERLNFAIYIRNFPSVPIEDVVDLREASCSSVAKSVRSWCDGSSDRLSFFSFQTIFHDW